MKKIKVENAWINGGFFILDPSIIDFIETDMTAWEADPVKKITAMGQMRAFKHDGFWQPMDTLNEKNYLNELYLKKSALGLIEVVQIFLSDFNI